MGVRENRAADEYDPAHLSSGIPSGCDAAAGVWPEEPQTCVNPEKNKLHQISDYYLKQ